MTRELMCDECNGVHIPRVWTNNTENIWGIPEEKWEEMQSMSPDHEWYWEAWQEILDMAKHVDQEGNTWRLYQDGDLWAYDEHEEFEEC